MLLFRSLVVFAKFLFFYIQQICGVAFIYYIMWLMKTANYKPKTSFHV